MIISVCGLLGYETARKVFDLNSDACQKRFPPFFIRQFTALEKELVSGVPTAEGAEIIYYREISQGGLFRALWEAGEALGCGMKIAGRVIPIRQEVIEILELSGETPYECGSEGSMLVITDRKTEEVMFAGRKASLQMIGITTEDNARVIEDKDSVRFLTPPVRQDKDAHDRNSSGHLHVL